MLRFRIALPLLLAAPGALTAQGDSLARLPALTVTVTRTPGALARAPQAVTVLDSGAVRRLRSAGWLDEALAFVPGLLVADRGNPSVDQRLVIRGAGARANFGMRGVKILVDGVPQTLPDGQSQLTNLDLGTVAQVEVLRGAASALYGNASAGVVAFRTAVVPARRAELRSAVEGGGPGLFRSQLSGALRTGRFAVTLGVSRLASDGARQHAATTQHRGTLAAEWWRSAHTTVSLRAAWADDPRAENPGALTLAEWRANPDSAAGANLLRGADKAVRQGQLSLGLRHARGAFALDVTTWGLLRDLENPLTTPPPAPALPTEGTWVGIDRLAGGFRAAATVSGAAGLLTAGVDLQAMRDDRENRRSAGGRPTDVRLLDQRERVREIGAFLQAVRPLSPRLALRAGARLDRVRFAVDDHLRTEGDLSGARTMGAASGNVGLSATLADGVTAWSGLATTFETPTTTELANRPDGSRGFNPALDPQRSVGLDAGLRVARGPLAVEAAAWRTRTRDAIVAWREVGGRSFFRNAGRTATDGIEAGLDLALTPRLRLLGSWTWTRATFAEYRLADGAVVDTLDGHRLAGVPAHVARIGLRGVLPGGVRFDLSQALSGALYGDDRNTLRVDGWGAGVTSLRLAWEGTLRGVRIAPFVAATNLFDRRYVGSVTINGAAGRVLEPAARRALFVGTMLDWGRGD